MADETKVQRRSRMDGVRRVMVGGAVRPELREVLEREAFERKVPMSTLVGDVLAEHAGVAP